VRTEEHRRPTLGFFLEHEANGPYVVNSVDAEGPAAPAGLQAGDVIVNWNGGEVPKRVERWLQEQRAGDSLKLRIRREERDLTLEFKIGEISETVYQVVEDPHASEKARHIREGMLHGETSAVAVH
jgi:predicted metalloprotease with PDZ domain